MQIALFDGAPAAAKPVRPSPAAQPPARIDGKAQYEDRQRDLDQLADRWEDLHVWVLRRHLRLIASPHTGDAERADILAWLDAPPVFDRPAGAFSVQACLAVYDGRIDVAEFQQLVRRIHRQVLDRRRARAV